MLSNNSRYSICIRTVINNDVIDNHSISHGVKTNTNDKTNIQTTSYKKNGKATVHKYNDDSNLIKRQSANSSALKKEVFVIGI